jgi:23S rRNA (guanosine2251-2'-O)-methyltransferase
MKNQKNLQRNNKKPQHHKKTQSHKTFDLNKNKQNNQSNSSNNNFGDSLWLCGKHASFSAILNKRRKIFEILVTQNSLSELEEFLQKNSLTSFQSLVKITDKDHLERLFARDQTPHQGIAVLCSKLPLKNQNDLLEELYKIDADAQFPTLLLLDQISDPHNVGAIIRSAMAFGVKHIVFCEHNSVKESATIVKSSAGTIDFAELFVVTNFSNLMEKLKKIGYWCIGLAGEGKANLNLVSEYKNIALVIGSEGNGLRDLVKRNCDLLAKIEMNSEVESLNASVAASIALYEITRNKL